VVNKIKEFVPPFDLAHETFKTRSIPESEMPWIRTRHIWTGVLGNIYGTFLNPVGIYFTLFAFASGMSKFQLGIMASLISFAVTFQIFSWLLENLWGSRKYTWYIFSVLSRLSFVPIVLSYWLPVHTRAIIALCAVSAVFSNIATPPWSSWLYDLFPGKKLPGFMSRRSAIVQLFVMLLAFFASFIVQKADIANKMTIIRFVFAFGVLIGIIDLFFHVRIPEPHKKTHQEKIDFLQSILLPLKDERFRQWILILLFWTISINICESFFIPYLIKDLGFGNKFILLTLISVCLVQISAFVGFLYWGKLIEKFGTRKVFLVCHTFWALVPLCYVFSRSEKSIVLISIAWLITGVFMNGTTIVNPAIASMLTRGKTRSAYIAMMTVVSSLFGGFGTLLGSFIVKYASIWYVFPASLGARILCLIFMFYVILNGKIYEKENDLLKIQAA
jgi:MFS family permease